MSKPTYCPKCHKVVALITENNKGKKLIQNGNVLINVPKGSSGNTLTLKCPDSHDVIVEV